MKMQSTCLHHEKKYQAEKRKKTKPGHLPTLVDFTFLWCWCSPPNAHSLRVIAMYILLLFLFNFSNAPVVCRVCYFLVVV